MWIAIIFHRFVDGSSYFEAVADALEKAKEEIFITDWWYVFSLRLFNIHVHMIVGICHVSSTKFNYIDTDIC